MISIIRKPILTEKGMSKSGEREYQFYVEPTANKLQIKKAVEAMFEVVVDNVRTANIKGKRSARYTKKGLMRGKTALRKKAYVKLKEGHEIELVSGGSND
jgi:large subunit ribosomal protein L23